MLKYPAWTFVVRVGGGTMAVDSDLASRASNKKCNDENKTQIQKNIPVDTEKRKKMDLASLDHEMKF